MRYRERAAALDITAFVLAGLAGLSLLLTDVTAPLLGWLPAVVLAPSALAALTFAAWRDAVLFAKHAAVAGMFMVFAGLLGLLMGEPTARLMAFEATAVLAVVGLLAWGAWAQRRGGPAPGALSASAGGEPVFEYERVHSVLRARLARTSVA